MAPLNTVIRPLYSGTVTRPRTRAPVDHPPTVFNHRFHASVVRPLVGADLHTASKEITFRNAMKTRSDAAQCGRRTEGDIRGGDGRLAGRVIAMTAIKPSVHRTGQSGTGSASRAAAREHLGD